jgi:hypothetical protein
MIILKPNKYGIRKELTEKEQERLSYNRRAWLLRQKYKNITHDMLKLFSDYSRIEELKLSRRAKIAVVIIGTQE